MFLTTSLPGRVSVLLSFICLSAGLSPLAAQPAGYAYGKVVTIQWTQVSGTQTNFPVLISVIDPNLRTIGNGGHVQNANGYDIIFTQSNGVTLLNFQLERYVATTGELEVWVSVPSVSSAANTVIAMYYGNASVSTDASTTAVWDANYIGVWHFGGNLTDGTANARNLTNFSTATFVGSKIGYGRQLANNPFVASNSGACQYLKMPNNSIGGLTNFTFEGWVYLDDNATNWERIFDFGQGTNVNMFLSPSILTNGVKRFAITTAGNAGEQQVSSATTTGIGAWHFYSVTINNTNNTATLYFDGAVDATNTAVTLRPTNMSADIADYFGRSQYAADNCLYGKFDEFRISSSVRNASWVQTSYNNQNSPSTFSLMGAEKTAAGTLLALPVTLHSFDATVVAGEAVRLQWVTEAEKDNRQFILERSADGNQWESFITVPASDSGAQTYTAYDKNPYHPVTYYRLRQEDVDGKQTLLSVISVKLSSGLPENISLYPNPAQDHINITLKNGSAGDAIKTVLADQLGRIYAVPVSISGNTLVMTTSQLPNGAYILTVYAGGRPYTQKLVVAR